MAGLLRRRLILIAGGLLAGLVLVEGAMQVAGVVARTKANARLKAKGDPKLPLVAFVGDSNIYGAYVPDDSRTLPGWFELYAGRFSSTPMRTLNFGVPASPSWLVLEQCRHALEFHPALVVARCGINNQWQVAPGKGLGILEDLKLVRWVRRTLFNRAVKPVQSEEDAKGFDRFSIDRPSRSGEQQTIDVVRPKDPIPFEDAMAKLRVDLEAMADLCDRAGAKLVLATYSASFEASFSHTRTTMLEIAKRRALPVADCGPVVDRAIRGGGTMPAPADYAEETARHAALLSRDRHPTELGYSIEGAVLATALAEAGYLKDLKPIDPFARLAAAGVHAPKLEAMPGRRGAFRLECAKDDRPILALGIFGQSVCRELLIQIDWRGLQTALGRVPFFEPAARGENATYAEFSLPEAVLAKLPSGVSACAVIERGGEFGAARVCASNSVLLTP